MNDNQKKLEDLGNLAKLLDSKFTGPFGIRFGLDALIGLIPGVGDFVTSALSVYVMAQAAQAGVSSATLIRMAINIFIENAIDMIPFFGNLFDFYWKANNKNIALLKEHLANPARETIRSRTVVAVIGVMLFALLAFSAYLSIRILMALYYWITSSSAS